jgi:hypothetical protein
VWAKLQGLGKGAVALAGGIAVLIGLGIVIGWLIRGDGNSLTVNSDTPPPDYLYIDNDRVLSYLGQIEIGLASQEKRTSAASRAFEFSAGAQGASGTKSQQTSQSVEVEVKPTTADRFYQLLPLLIEGRSKNPDRPWIHDLNGEAREHYNIAKHASGLCRVHEGDFVRIENAHLFLPPYAAILQKVRYAQRVVKPQLPLANQGEQATPRPHTNAAAASTLQPAIKAYQRRLGSNPRLPFLVPTIVPSSNETMRRVVFFIPVRYRWIAEEPSLLSGSLTVVGKVTFRDLRLPGRNICGRQTSAESRPHYFDQQTLLAFGPALQAAPDQLLASVGLERKNLLPTIRDSATFDAPVMVIVPLAIYQ